MHLELVYSNLFKIAWFCFVLIFIARQHAMHADVAAYFFGNCVHLSSRPSNSGTVSMQMHVSSHFLVIW